MGQFERCRQVKIAIGCDHAGFALKQEIRPILAGLEAEVVDCGTNNTESVDYPDFGGKVSAMVSSGAADRGILICGTGLGMSMVANKYPGVRAALCNDLFSAKMSRLHNDANVLVMGGRIIGRDLAAEIVKVWLTTSFEGARHLKRLDKIAKLEKELTENGTN